MKVGTVTGGSRGIGAATAVACAGRGIGVVLTYNRNPAAAAGVVAEIEGLGGRAVALRLDVSESSSFNAFGESVRAVLRERWGREDFDFLVNNAGYGLYSPIATVTEEQFDGLFDGRHPARVDYDDEDGPPGHPDLFGFGANGRSFFWLRPGEADTRSAHVGFVADSETEVEAACAAALQAGATDTGRPEYGSYRQRGRPAYGSYRQRGARRTGATENGAAGVREVPRTGRPEFGSYRRRGAGVREYYDPRCYAGNVVDPDGYSLEFGDRSWQC